MLYLTNENQLENLPVGSVVLDLGENFGCANAPVIACKASDGFWETNGAQGRHFWSSEMVIQCSKDHVLICVHNPVLSIPSSLRNPPDPPKNSLLSTAVMDRLRQSSHIAGSIIKTGVDEAHFQENLIRLLCFSPDPAVRSEILSMGLRSYACGMSEELLSIFLKISSAGTFTGEDINQLREVLNGKAKH